MPLIWIRQEARVTMNAKEVVRLRLSGATPRQPSQVGSERSTRSARTSDTRRRTDVRERAGEVETDLNWIGQIHEFQAAAGPLRGFRYCFECLDTRTAHVVHTFQIENHAPPRDE